MPTSHRAPDDGKHRFQPGDTDLRGSMANVEPRQPRSYAGLLIRRGHEEATKVLGRIGSGQAAKRNLGFGTLGRYGPQGSCRSAAERWWRTGWFAGVSAGRIVLQKSTSDVRREEAHRTGSGP